MANKSTLTADERLALINIKVERAKKHIVELNSEIRRFFDSNPYEIGTKRNPDTRQLIYYVSRAAPIPDNFATITGDAIQNLRTALDHLMHQLWDVANPRIPAHRDILFPTDSNAHQFKSSAPRKIKGLRQDAIDTLYSIEPYDGGKGANLSILNRLNRIDKHRFLIAVGMGSISFNLGAYISGAFNRMHPGANNRINLRIPRDIYPLEYGTELFTDDPGAEVNKDYDFTFGVTLHEPGVVERKPLLETIQQLADFVSSTIVSFRPCLS